MKCILSKSRNILFLVILSCSSMAHSQIERDQQMNPRLTDNVRFGGSLGLTFSNNLFNAHLAPKAVYDFNRYFSAGIGVAGSYTDASRYSAFTIGGSTIGLFRPIPVLQTSAELEQNYVSKNLEWEGSNLKDSYWYPALFLGLGYTTGPVTVGLKYDVLYDDQKSIYGNALMPFVSIYF